MSDRGPRADASLPPDSDVVAKAKTIRDACTPGPWVRGVMPVWEHDIIVSATVFDDDEPAYPRPILDGQNYLVEADARFIMAAPELVDGLIEEVDRLRATLAHAKATLEDISVLEGIRYERAVSFALAALAVIDHASLPDRVEAAEVAKHLRWALMELEGYDPKWTAPEPMRDAWQCVLDVEAAADACEAERNPNTTDEYEQVGWYSFEADEVMKMDHPNLSGPYAVSEKRLRAVGLVPLMAARRPVSSEDVHREATE